MRVKNSIYNVILAALYYVVLTLTGLFLRKVFIQCLGLGYVGLDNVFANILSFLSLVELGIGPAITYKLYAPLADGNTQEIRLLLAVYKKFYRYVAMAISAIGVVLAFFIPFIVKDAPMNNYRLIVCYFLYLASTVVSYHLAHKRSLLVADQKQYLATLIDIIFNIIVFVIKVIVLKATQDYYLVLVINIVRVLVSNIIISIFCDKKYPYLKEKKILEKKDVALKAKSMILDIKYIMLHKFCNYVYSSTDGIVISTFMGVASVGLLANYNMIVSVVTGLFMQCSSSIQSSIGNLVSVAKDNKMMVQENLKRLSFIYHVVISFCTTALFCLLTPFVQLWLGVEYILAWEIVLVICVNMYIYSFYQPIANVYTVAGLFKEDKLTSASAAIVNIVVSVVTVKQFGLIGVYVGTILGSCVYIFGRTHIVYKKYFEESPYLYYKEFVKYLTVTSVECAITYIITYFCFDSGMIGFAGKMAVCLVVPNAINLLIFRKTKEFDYLKNLVLRIIKRVK